MDGRLWLLLCRPRCRQARPYENGTIALMEPSGSSQSRVPFSELTNTTIQGEDIVGYLVCDVLWSLNMLFQYDEGTQTLHHVDPKECDRERRRFLEATMSDEKRSEYKKTHRERRMRRKSEQDDSVHLEAYEKTGWLHRGDLGENKDRLHVETSESGYSWRDERFMRSKLYQPSV
ncbi:hypothetical protein SEVIR_7G209001v4 [Setaria viridis]